MLSTILIANRGEIAIRIIRACRLLNFKTVAIFSDIDSTSLHIKMADEAFCLGSGDVQDTYLNIEKIIEIALKSQSDAIHPGYGFLSESAIFAEEVEKNGLIFVGPSPSILHRLGNKIEAKKMAKEAGILTVPGSSGYINSVSEAEQITNKIGYPIIIKAAYGGGGRGMEIVENPDALEISLMGCQTIASKFFGSSEVFIEKYIHAPRHVEIQFLADNFGNVIHIGDRECSIQRSYQKIIEEAPSFISARRRNSLGEKICNLAKKLSYRNAGTAEFLWKDRKLYFNEINPRIQVEHPVTEMITGIDLVVQQLRVANNEELSYSQKDIKFSGHALEFRINAEDPLKAFYPQTGKILSLNIPGGNDVRFDTFIYPNYNLPNQYDSLIGKLIIRGENREDAIQKSRLALNELAISGLTTNISLHKAIIETEEFQHRQITTDFLERTKINQILNHYEKLKLVALLIANTIHKQKQDYDISNIQRSREDYNRWREQNKLEQQNGYR
ncbi:MAG: acetyl-CoA carboxylase biotin carboxylase subunit [Candidatus Heimdallarchaeota archaeon]|nr:acetyl-CoA carboxylase biotin carboxylase subunit [Candidatus Heimdallarchaeota archaeon]